MLTVIVPRLRRFAAARLSPEGEFGLHLTLGIAALLVACGVFGYLASEVHTGAPLTLFDVRVAQWLHAHGQPLATVALLFVTHWNAPGGILAMAGLLACWLYRRGESYWLLALAATVPGGFLLNVCMKLAFQRARPVFDDPLLMLDTYSFPSGHTVGATLLYGFLACWLVHHRGLSAGRGLLAVAACAMIVLVGFSRLYLGAHYLTDVLAAVAEGAAWLAICITAVSTLRRRRQARAGL